MKNPRKYVRCKYLSIVVKELQYWKIEKLKNSETVLFSKFENMYAHENSYVYSIPSSWSDSLVLSQIMFMKSLTKLVID